MERVFVVLSGLPGSGKTTLGRPLSAALALPLLDKDDILEGLFEALDVSTPEERSRLSRAGDRVLQAVAGASQGAVLSSFWRQESVSTSAGTPTQWLRETPEARIVEIACECPPALAAARFVARHRHPGHFDDRRTATQLAEQFDRLTAAGPVGLGRLLRVDTSGPVDVAAVAQAVRAATAEASSVRTPS